MKRFKVNGDQVRRLRLDRERSSTQAELAHEVRISERKLRMIETRNAEVTADVLDRLSKAFNVPRQVLVFAVDKPALVRTPGYVERTHTAESTKPNVVVIPRHDTTIASARIDECLFFEEACSSDVVLSYIQTKMTTDTSAYADEFIDILQSLTRTARTYPRLPLDGRETLKMQSRIRELTVLLKGNDVWIYAATHFKRLPESDTMRDDLPELPSESQLLIAFGPPGEYGETTVHVPIDYGRPWSYDSQKLPF